MFDWVGEFVDCFENDVVVLRERGQLLVFISDPGFLLGLMDGVFGDDVVAVFVCCDEPEGGVVEVGCLDGDVGEASFCGFDVCLCGDSVEDGDGVGLGVVLEVDVVWLETGDSLVVGELGEVAGVA